MYMRLQIWTDATSRPKMLSKKNKGKDGPSACSIIVKNNNTIIKKDVFYAGIIDNNQAEYVAFIKSVEYVLKLKNIKHVTFYTDSNLIEKQMNSKYNAHKNSIKPYYNKATSLLSQLNSWEVKWISRKENREADKMAHDFIKKLKIENII